MNCCLPLTIVAEAVGTRLKRREGIDVRLFLRGVRAAWREGNLHVDAGSLGGFFDRRAAAEDDQVGKRNLLAFARLVEIGLDRLELLQHFRQLGRIVHVPILLRAQANTRTIGAATLVDPPVKTPCLDLPVLAPSTRRPPRSTVISGAVSLSNCARSTRASSAIMY